MRFRKKRVLLLVLSSVFILCFYATKLLYTDVDSLEHQSDVIYEGNLAERGHVSDRRTRRSRKCRPQINISFIKCMKCGTETLGTVFRRFGYMRNLSFVLPVDHRLYLGWPYQLEPYDYCPSSSGFNILMEHAIYNDTIMQTLMPEDTKYITMIREPFNHFLSSFFYFRIANITNMTASDPVSEYLHNIEKYEKIYQSPAAAKTRYCIPHGFSVTKNIQSHCLGFPLGFPPWRKNITNDPLAIQEYIAKLDQEFTLVMIMDYFDESLVMLKHEFCWTFQDILYWPQNFGKYGKVETFRTPENMRLHKPFDSVDYLLFDHFNKTFWKKVENYPRDFFAEVKAFRDVKAQVTQFCMTTPENSTRVFKVRNSRYTRNFDFFPDECPALQVYLLDKLREVYELREGKKAPGISKLSKAFC